MRFAERVTGRANSFDFLRLAFASLVILSHSFYVLNVDGEPLAWLTQGQTAFGQIALESFFIISGFLVTQSWANSHSVFDYIKKRILRIHPGFVVAFVFSMLIVAPLAASDPRGYLTSIQPLRFAFDALTLRKIELLPAFASNPRPGEINASLWTIRIEFECYILVAILGLLRLYRHRRLLLAGFVLLVVRMATGLIFLDDSRLDLITYFLSGALVYLYRDCIPYSRTLCIASIVALIGSTLTHQLHAVSPIAGTYLLLYFALHPASTLTNFTRRGDLSYGVYLYGFPVQQLLTRYLGAGLSPYLLTTLALIVTYPIAALSWRFVEKRALALKSWRIKRVPAPQSPSAVPVAAIDGA